MSMNHTNREILTVKQLRELLEGRDENEHVVIADDGWYTNITAVALPDDEEFSCVTLFPGVEFDSRQL